MSILDDTLPELDDAADLSDDEPEELAPADPPSPSTEKLLADIADAETQCQEAERQMNDAKQVLKDAKAEYDGCVLTLRRLAKAVRNDEDRPLFAGLDDEDEAYDARLAESIDVLDLPEGVVSKLNESGVLTIGGLEDLRSEITLGRKQWPKGIGPQKIDLIETVVVEWLAENCLEADDTDEADLE